MQRRPTPGAPMPAARDAWLSQATVAAVAVLAFAFSSPLDAAARAEQGVDRRQQSRLDDALRRESDALVEIAEATMDGRRPPSDFSLEWRNDFLKAQPGTFVPFTIGLDTTLRSPLGALMYVRVVERPVNPARQRQRELPFPYETVFPVDPEQTATLPVRIRRGFAVSPGSYTVVVVLRERPENPLDRSRKNGPQRTGILTRQLDVPDFWTNSLATSTVILADRVEQLSEAVPAGRLDENPYVVGTNRIHPSAGSLFRRDGELVVVFLIYNPSVGPDRHFDVQVDYHLYKKLREGERYVTRTNPQRFNPSMMGAHFDPAAGQPVLAGQGIPLSSFEAGEYRLGITVTDLLSRTSVARDVTFTVIGS
jgi:hypothetical protein